MILHETIANFIEEVKLINWFEESGIPNELDFRYVCGKIRKDECPDVITLTAKVSKAIVGILKEYQNFWSSLTVL